MRAVFPIVLLLTLTGPALAQFDALPDSPLDTNMGDAAGDVGGTLNQVTPQDEFEQEQEEERQEELLENRYDVPDDEEEFNKNAPQNP